MEQNTPAEGREECQNIEKTTTKIDAVKSHKWVFKKSDIVSFILQIKKPKRKIRKVTYPMDKLNYHPVF